MTIDGLLFLLLISFLVNIFFFVFASTKKTDKFTDLAYGLTFIILSWLAIFKYSSLFWYQFVLVIMVNLWAIRLSGYLFVRILKIKKDSRFDQIREKPLEFLKFWLLQAVSVWLIFLPVAAVLFSKTPVETNFLTILGFIIWAGGLAIESIADIQKFRFKDNPKNRNSWIQTGLWRYSRHPNYFGEISLWWGVWLYSVSLSVYNWPTIVGPLYIAFLILFVTGVPTVEKRMDKKFSDSKDYWQYKRKTSVIIPLPKKS